MTTPTSDSQTKYVWPDVLLDIRPEQDIDEQLDRILTEVRQKPKLKTSPWIAQHGDYRAMLDWANVLSTIPIEQYETYSKDKLLDTLQEWSAIMVAVWHYGNRYAIARLAPESFKRVQALLHQLWRKTRRPFAKTLRANGRLDAKEVKQRINPLMIYERYSHLEKNGHHRYKILCPYHDDQRPSLVVYEDGSHYCFSCNQGGDVFDYVQRVEKCNFPDAVGIVASIGV